MGKGGYNGGSTVVRAAIGFVGGRSGPATMTPGEAEAGRANRDRVRAQRSAKSGKALRNALEKLSPVKAAKNRAADAETSQARRAMQKAKLAGVDPMAGVEVRRITSRTLQMRGPPTD